VARLVCQVHAQKKPVTALCIAPTVIAKMLKSEKPKLTIGTDQTTAKNLETIKTKHVTCKIAQLAVDRKKKLVSTPTYMLGRRISEMAENIDKTVAALVEIT
jgi:enhancing lycopene biosynthesis protein 2